MKWYIITLALFALALPPIASAAGGKASTPATPAPSCAVVSAVMLLLDGQYADVFCPSSVIRVSVGAFQPLPAIGAAAMVRTAGGSWFLTQAGEAWQAVAP